MFATHVFDAKYKSESTKRNASDLSRRKQISYGYYSAKANDINCKCWKPESSNIYSVVFPLFSIVICNVDSMTKYMGFSLRFGGFDSLRNISIHWMIISKMLKMWLVLLMQPTKNSMHCKRCKLNEQCKRSYENECW